MRQFKRQTAVRVMAAAVAGSLWFTGLKPLTLPVWASEPILVAGSDAAIAVSSRQVQENEDSEKGTKATAVSWSGSENIQTAAAGQPGPEIAAPSAILMEASTGQVVYEKNADEARSPASITKIMTLILIFDALESGKIQMTDQVVTSAYAKSMGGSQVFL